MVLGSGKTRALTRGPLRFSLLVSGLSVLELGVLRLMTSEIEVEETTGAQHSPIGRPARVLPFLHLSPRNSDTGGGRPIISQGPEPRTQPLQGQAAPKLDGPHRGVNYPQVPVQGRHSGTFQFFTEWGGWPYKYHVRRPFGDANTPGILADPMCSFPRPATRGRPQDTRKGPCTSGSDNSNGKTVASWTMS